MRRTLRIALAALQLVLAIPPFAVTAQDRGSGEERAILPDYMIAVPIADLPRPDAQMWLFWLTMQPGAALPSRTSPGAMLLLVEQGEVLVTSNQPLTVRSSGDTRPASIVTPDARGYRLIAGDGALLADTGTMGIANPGAGIAHVLMLVMSSARSVSTIASMPPYRDLPGTVRLQPLSFGEALFPEGSGVLVIERHGYPRGTTAFTSTFRGVELGAIMQGSGDVLFQRGRGLIWNDVFGAFDIPGFPWTKPVGQGETAPIGSGDGYSGQDASLHWYTGEGDRMVVVRAQVIPIPFPD